MFDLHVQNRDTRRMNEVQIENRNLNNEMMTCDMLQAKCNDTPRSSRDTRINVRHIERAECWMTAKRVTHRKKKRQPDFDVERPRSGKTRRLTQPEIAENRKRGEDHEGGSGEENARRLRDRLVSMAS